MESRIVKVSLATDIQNPIIKGINVAPKYYIEALKDFLDKPSPRVLYRSGNVNWGDPDNQIQESDIFGKVISIDSDTNEATIQVRNDRNIEDIDFSDLVLLTCCRPLLSCLKDAVSVTHISHSVLVKRSHLVILSIGLDLKDPKVCRHKCNPNMLKDALRGSIETSIPIVAKTHSDKKMSGIAEIVGLVRHLDIDNGMATIEVFSVKTIEEIRILQFKLIPHVICTMEDGIDHIQSISSIPYYKLVSALPAQKIMNI